MQAILLAGGSGSRLQGLIQVPKPMIMVDGEPFLAGYIRQLVAQGVQEVVLALHHQADFFQDYFQDRFAGIPIRYSIEDTPLGTGGAIRHALHLLQPKASVFVSNSDSVMDLDIRAMQQFHVRQNAALTLAAMPARDCSKGGEIQQHVNGSYRFCYPGNTKAGLLSMGAYWMRPDIFDRYELPKAFSFESDFKAAYLHEVHAQLFMHSGKFLDFGTPERLKEVQWQE